ncbi:MAG: RecX family transcriptional regulator [Coriobacteriales bacterium]|jgi:SOS response regulatory protein OraA/RecX|nr:RecX family transcriptional regulator [Coriobacteriales bacterium]
MPGREQLAEQLQKARCKTEQLLNYRDRTSQELKARLMQAGFSLQVAETETRLAQQAGLIDDERFTRLYVASKRNSGWGQVRIVRELRRYGIDLQADPASCAELFDEQDELRKAMDCATRFRSRAQDQRSACFRRLITRGFSVDVARKTLSQLTF